MAGKEQPLFLAQVCIFLLDSFVTDTREMPVMDVFWVQRHIMINPACIKGCTIRTNNQLVSVFS